MPSADPLIALLKSWCKKADNDLITASHSLKLGRECPTDTVCFHAQQCVEKYLKAILVLKQIEFPRTHNIRGLLNLMPGRLVIEIDELTQARLTEYATVARYPGEDDPIPLAEARQAVRTARRVRQQVRRLLPRAALRRK